jgi:hypothetical protein
MDNLEKIEAIKELLRIVKYSSDRIQVLQGVLYGGDKKIETELNLIRKCVVAIDEYWLEGEQS